MVLVISRRHRSLAALVITAAVVLCLGAIGEAQQQALVTGIVDGDTIHVVLGNRTETVRYIGINTPELHHPTRGREPGGDVAREVNRQIVEGKWVTLYFRCAAA